MRRLAVAGFAVLTLLATGTGRADDDAHWHYTVQAGDTLIGIAERWLQRPQQWRALQRLNGVAEPRRMATGRTLRVPWDWLRPEAVAATVVVSVGTVERVATDGSSQSLAAGAVLHAGDRVRTGGDGEAVLEFADGSQLQVAPGTSLALHELLRFQANGMLSTRVDLRQGRSEVEIAPRAPTPRFEMRTPRLTLGVRGTRFRAQVDPDGAVVRAEVTAGSVRVAGPAGEPAVLAAGQGLVGDAAGLSPPRALPAAPDLAALPQRIERLPLQLDWGGSGTVPAGPAAGGVEGWRVQLRDADDPRRLLRDGRFDATRASWPAQPELPDGRYVVRVRAVDPTGLEGLDSERVVTLAARPVPPVTLAPRADVPQYGPSARWQWALAEDATRYRLQVSARPDFTELLVDLSDLPGPTVQHPLPAGVWYWRMASVTADGRAGPWGDAQRVEQRELPPPPTTEAPRVDGKQLLLRWSARTATDRYRVQVARDTGFADLLLDREVDSPQLELPLPAPGRYRLRVQTLDADGQPGPWGPASELEVPRSPWWWLAPAALLLWLVL